MMPIIEHAPIKFEPDIFDQSDASAEPMSITLREISVFKIDKISLLKIWKV